MRVAGPIDASCLQHIPKLLQTAQETHPLQMIRLKDGEKLHDVTVIGDAQDQVAGAAPEIDIDAVVEVENQIEDDSDEGHVAAQQVK